MVMGKMKVLFVLKLFLLGPSLAGGNICSEDELQGVSEKDVVQEIVQYGHYVQFKCCARNTTEITWSKWSNDSDAWVTLDPNVDDVNFHHHRQIMSINSAGFDDKGFYKCNVHSDSISTQTDKKFELEVIACDVLARGPFPIAPLPCSETVTNVESTLTLPCTGYFGCGERNNMRVVTWLVSPLDKDDSWEPVSSVDGKRYVTKNFNREGYSIIGTNLTIHRVSSIDFHRKFMCVLATPQMIEGQSKLVVRLTKGDGDPVDSASISPLTFVIIASVASVLGLISVVISFVAVFKAISVARQRERNEYALEKIPIYTPKWTVDRKDEFTV